MLDVAGGILIAVIVLAIIGKAGRYWKKRKAAKIEYAAAYKEHQEMEAFVTNPERVKAWKAVQFKCRYFAGAYFDDKMSAVPEIADKAAAMLEGVIQKVLSEADNMQDEYCRSFFASAYTAMPRKVTEPGGR